MKSLAVTGHRPSKLPWGYSYNEHHWMKLKDVFKSFIVVNEIEDAFTGMALGVDTVFALAVLELKDEGHDIRLHAVIPCCMQYCKWESESVDLYFSILARADEIIGMSEQYEDGFVSLSIVETSGNYSFVVKSTNESYSQEYKPYLLRKRNVYMVDNSESVLAVWDGTCGGTANCVEYAYKSEKQVIVISPESI